MSRTAIVLAAALALAMPAQADDADEAARETCGQQANARGLKGKEREQFMKECTGAADRGHKAGDEASAVEDDDDGRKGGRDEAKDGGKEAKKKSGDKKDRRKKDGRQKPERDKPQKGEQHDKPGARGEAPTGAASDVPVEPPTRRASDE
jgi:hypothetical protein